MIGSFKDGQLKRFWSKGSAKGISAQDAEWIKELLSSLDAATCPEDMNLAGYGFHPLTGNRRGQYAVTIRGNWRLVFEWEEGAAVRVRQEDYHGR